ncbi:MAG: D-alanine--D-alanine ligase family protein, partial [Elusimicrobiales bacterium]|nr:D-alanine--D-alanine ligase family protein [Elusimicrobiales bacterium]
KKLVAVIYGGRSSEHEVSIESAKTVMDLAEKAGFSAFPVLIGRDGRWSAVDPRRGAKGPALSFDPADGSILKGRVRIRPGCYFPIVHGTTGEDGALQGLLEMAGTAYAGCGVEASAIGMDKVLSKKLAAERGVPVLPHVLIEPAEKGSLERGLRRAASLPLPLFVKPVSLGSSVGVTKVKSRAALKAAVRKALRFGPAVMIERGVDGAREIVVGVLGEGASAASSVCGEVKPKGRHEFFDYEAKYLDDDGMDFVLPASLPAGVARRLREHAAAAFRALGCSGMARVDFLADPRDPRRFWFCEINTAPGFTSHSLYPRLWNETGVSPERVVARLVRTGEARRSSRARLSIARK